LAQKTQKIETIFCGKSVFGVNVGGRCPVAEMVSKSGDRSGMAFSDRLRPLVIAIEPNPPGKAGAFSESLTIPPRAILTPRVQCLEKAS
jgi:hypothetical protein